MEYFTRALAYQASADTLRGQLPSQLHLPLGDPIYYLYHHAVELALRACLKANNLRAEEKRHNIVKLFEQCKKEKLLGVTQEHSEMHQLLVYLNVEGSGNAHRYTGSDLVPDLDWVKEVVRQLFADVEPHLKAWGKKNGIAGPWDPPVVTRLRFSVGPPARR